MDNSILEAMKALEHNGDTESAHYEADRLLCQQLNELGYSRLVDAYNQIKKWYA